MNRTALTKAPAKPVHEFLLIPLGPVEVEQAAYGHSFTWTRHHADQTVRWFSSLGRKLSIDYEHQTFPDLNLRSDGLSPAAGWIGRLEARADGLWALDVTWTSKARELIAAGEYRYFSPVIYWTDQEYSNVESLGPVGLTNDPAMKRVSPLAASRESRSSTYLAARPLLTAGGATAASKLRLANAATDSTGDAEDDGSQAAEFLEGIASTKAFFDYAFEAFIPVKQFLDRSDEMGREAWLRAADALLQQAKPGPMSRAVELIELLSEVEEHRDLIESTEDVAPAAQASAGSASASVRSRMAFISAARRSYAAEAAHRGNTPIGPESSWVNAALRDAGRRELTNAELNGIVGRNRRNHGSVLKLNPERAQNGDHAMDISMIAEALGLEAGASIEQILEAISNLQAALEEAQGGGGGGVAVARARRARQRPGVILAARRSFAAEAADSGKRMITSERNWVNLALRDAKCRGLAQNEIAKYGISEEP
jgi:hypothetical protein